MSDNGPSFQDLQDFEKKRCDGPFLFSDYWASVLNLKGIVNLESLSSVGMSLESFRKFLNRPSAGLPRFGYLILYSLLKPFLVVFSLFRRLLGLKRTNRCGSIPERGGWPTCTRASTSSRRGS